ncbi:MAG: hypothetical protein FJ215_01430 [Ignavibacteria bacterium]|nr:hypothetical protein [Ignavibacteria bacterium]
MSSSRFTLRFADLLHDDRALLRLALIVSIALHVLLSFPLALLIRAWLPSRPRVVLPQAHQVFEISLYRQPHRPEVHVREPVDRQTVTSPIPPIDRIDVVALETKPSEISAIDSADVRRQTPKTKIDSLFGLLDEYPELKRAVFRELLVNQLPLRDSSEGFRMAVARSLARFYEGSYRYGSLQRKDAIYVSPYDPFRPHGLLQNVNMIGLILAISRLINSPSQ